MLLSRRVLWSMDYAQTGRVDRRAVGADRAVATEVEASGTRTPAARSARGDEWDPVDIALGGALEGLARALSAIPDLPPALPVLGTLRCAAGRAQSAGRAFTKARRFGSVRVFHRCEFHRRKKGGTGVGPTKRGKGTKLMAIADGAGLPVAIHTEAASPHEARLLEPTLEKRFTRARPKRLIGDRAYDSDPLDAQLARQGIELIAPHRYNRAKPPTQDGRALRRAQRRWKIERLFAWLQNFRRLVTRWDYHAANFLGFVQLACIVILMRNYF